MKTKTLNFPNSPTQSIVNGVNVKISPIPYTHFKGLYGSNLFLKRCWNENGGRLVLAIWQDEDGHNSPELIIAVYGKDNAPTFGKWSKLHPATRRKVNQWMNENYTTL